MGAIPQSRQAIVTALYRDAALYRDTALLREAALFTPGYEYTAAVAPSDFDRLKSGSRLARTALLLLLYEVFVNVSCLIFIQHTCYKNKNTLQL